MNLSLAVLLVVLVGLAACGEWGPGPRVKREPNNLNFPGATDDRQGGQRPPNRRTTTRRPDPNQGPLGELTISSLGVVFQVPCPCPSPPQYNPVCGSDGRTYNNEQLLNCATQCGFNVRVDRLGTCSSPR